MDYDLGLYEKAMPAGLSWEEMLQATGAAGFDHLEISVDETDARLSRLYWTAEERLRLIRLTRSAGVPIRTMCLSGHRKYPLGSRDAHTRERGVEILNKAIDLAGDLGVRVIQLAGYDVYYEDGDVRTRDLFAQSLRRGVEYAARCGVTMGFETMETPFMDTITKGMTYVRYIDSPNLGMYPDLGNLTNACALYGSSVRQEIHAGRGRMFAMHLKETAEGRYRDMDFGKGHVDFVAGIDEALSSGVRLFVAEFWHDGRADWQERLKGANRFLRSAFVEAGASQR